MQREIKFRAWNKYTGMMEVMSIGDGRNLGYPLTEKSHVSCFYDEDHGAYSTWSGYSDERRTMDGSKSHCILMQFTGLKDKNGKEIYEGDVIELKQWNPSRYFIDFVEGGFCFKTKGALSTDINMIQDSTGIHAEVIGNIYENLALLSNPQ